MVFVFCGLNLDFGKMKKNEQIAQTTGDLNAGETAPEDHWLLEQHCGDLYGLFCTDGPEKPGAEAARRVIYISKELTHEPAETR